jgi:hypothetical protein
MLAAEILLDAECRLGEMLESTPRKPKPDDSSRGTFGGTTKRANSAKGTCTLPDGIDKKQSHEAQQLSKHMDAVEKCKVAAREMGEIRLGLLVGLAGMGGE